MSQVIISRKRKPRRVSQKSPRDILPKPHNGMLTEKEREKLLRYVELLTINNSSHLE